jgi:hypothetical protein
METLFIYLFALLLNIMANNQQGMSQLLSPRENEIKT